MPDDEVTSQEAATSASRVLRDPASSTDAKKAAGSALTQASDKKQLRKIAIAGAKVRAVIEPAVTELYITFPTQDDLRMSNGKYDILLVPSQSKPLQEG